MNKKYFVELTDEQRKELRGLISKGTGKALALRRARILLKADRNGPGWTDSQIATAFECHPRTVEGVRRRFVERGLNAVAYRERRVPSRKRCLDGAAEARLTALACAEAPDGHSRWTLRLLSERAVALEIVDSISHETVRTTLKKTL